MDILGFLREMVCEENQFLTNLGSIITIISGVSIISVIVGVLKKVWFSLRRIYVRPDCLEKKEVTKYTRLYIKTRLKANDIMFSSRKESYNIKKFIKKYLIKGDDQYHLIFGESGMGKTAFLINLYFIYNCKLLKKYDMYYVSLRSIEAIDQIKIFAEKNDPKKTILLLDAFDESKAASEDSSHAIKELLEITQNYCKVVISCRTQFYNAVNEEPQIVELRRAVLVEDEMFIKHYICPFTDYEVLRYLLKHYKLKFWKIFRGKQVIKKSSNIMARPLLLSYIDDIVIEHEEYKYAYQIYNTLIGKWIDREVHFIQKTSEKNIVISDYINSFWVFVYDIVKLMLQGAKNGNTYSVSSQDLNQLCSKYKIDLDIDKRSRTLLNRVGDDIFQFSHQSIFEFLLADGIRNGAVRLNNEYSGISALDQYKLFIREMYENQLLNKVVSSESLIILNLVTPLLIDDIKQDIHISCIEADPIMKKITFRLEGATQLYDAITIGNLKEISKDIKSHDFSQYNFFWLSDGNFPKTVRVNTVLFNEAKVSINNRNLFGRILFDMEKARIVIETSENVHVPYWDINMFIDDMPVNIILEFVNEQSNIADNHGNKVLMIKPCSKYLDIEISLHDLGG